MPKKQRLVSDYMVKEALTATPTTTFKKAIQLMIENKTNGLVVVDKKNRVKGILSSWDLIEHLVPDYLETDMHLASFEAGDQLGERAMQVKNDPISEYMTETVHTVKPDMNLMAAATMLSEYQIRQLPVVDDEGILVGYLNRTIVKLAIGEILGIKE